MPAEQAVWDGGRWRRRSGPRRRRGRQASRSRCQGVGAVRRVWADWPAGVVAGVGVEAGGLAGGWLVGAGGAGGLGGGPVEAT